MYESGPDPYCYPGTAVLINRLDIRDQARLDAFEAAITAQRAQEPLPAGSFDAARYCAVHRHLFQDVYDWAGEIRTVRISKGDSTRLTLHACTRGARSMPLSKRSMATKVRCLGSSVDC